MSETLIDVPVGMLRISKAGEPDRVVYPCHSDRWAEAGWLVHPPVLPDLDPDTDPVDPTDPDPDPVDPPSGPPVIASIEPVTLGDPPLYAVGQGATPSVVTGSDFEPGTTLEVGGGAEVLISDVLFVDSTTMNCTIDCSGISKQVRVPISAQNSLGIGAIYFLSVEKAVKAEVEAAGAPEAQLEGLDFEAMTKAEIIAVCEEHFGVTLDSHKTKAELVAEATQLAAQATQPASTDEADTALDAEGLGSLVPDLL